MALDWVAVFHSRVLLCYLLDAFLESFRCLGASWEFRVVPFSLPLLSALHCKRAGVAKECCTTITSKCRTGSFVQALGCRWSSHALKQSACLRAPSVISAGTICGPRRIAAPSVVQCRTPADRTP